MCAPTAALDDQDFSEFAATTDVDDGIVDGVSQDKFAEVWNEP